MAVFSRIPAGDLLLQNHKLIFNDGPLVIRKKISVRLRFFLGEWFMDRRQGIPAFQTVFVANPNKNLIRSIFRNVVVKTPGVASVPKFDAFFDLPVRHVSFSFHAILQGGTETLIISPQDRDFLVNVKRAA